MIGIAILLHTSGSNNPLDLIKYRQALDDYFVESSCMNPSQP